MNPYRLIVQCKLSESFFDKVVVALKRAVIRCNEMRYELGLDGILVRAELLVRCCL